VEKKTSGRIATRVNIKTSTEY